MIAQHYVIHFRLSLTLIAQLLASRLCTIWSRHYTGYSLVFKVDVNFNNFYDTDGRYQFAAIKIEPYFPGLQTDSYV